MNRLSATYPWNPHVNTLLLAYVTWMVLKIFTMKLYGWCGLRPFRYCAIRKSKAKLITLWKFINSFTKDDICFSTVQKNCTEKIFASSNHLYQRCLKPCSGMVLMSYNSQDMVRERKRMNLNKYMSDYTNYKVTSQFQFGSGKGLLLYRKWIKLFGSDRSPRRGDLVRPCVRVSVCPCVRPALSSKEHCKWVSEAF